MYYHLINTKACLEKWSHRNKNGDKMGALANLLRLQLMCPYN